MTFQCPLVRCEVAPRLPSLVAVLRHVLACHVEENPVEIRGPAEEIVCRADASAFMMHDSDEPATSPLKRASESAAEEERPSKVPREQESLTCPMCDKVLSSKWCRDRHLKAVHNIKQMPKFSDLCITALGNQADSEERDVNHNAVECSVCLKVYKSKKAVRDHLRKVHKIRAKAQALQGAGGQKVEPQDLDEEQQVVKEETKDDESLRDDEGVLSLEEKEEPLGALSIEGACRVCSKVLLNKKSLRAHEKDLHHFDSKLMDKIICIFCSVEMGSFFELEQHVKVEHQDMFTCSDCDKTFSMLKTIKHHMKEFHGR